MFIFANLLGAVAQVLDYVLWAYAWLVLGRVVISWVNVDHNNPIVRFVHAVTEPVLERVRRKLPILAGGFDFSPIVMWIAIPFLRYFLVRSLFDLAQAIS
jgi:YggT family protein